MKVSQFLGKTSVKSLILPDVSLEGPVLCFDSFFVEHLAVDGLCTIAGHVGRGLAPHVKKHSAKLIPESMKKDKDGRSNIDGAMVVAASGVQGHI